MFRYIESRGGEFSHTVMFGLQYIIQEYLAKPITHAMVDEAAEFWAAHGEPFDADGFRYIVDTLSVIRDRSEQVIGHYAVPLI